MSLCSFVGSSEIWCETAQNPISFQGLKVLLAGLEIRPHCFLPFVLRAGRTWRLLLPLSWHLGQQWLGGSEKHHAGTTLRALKMLLATPHPTGVGRDLYSLT